MSYVLIWVILSSQLPNILQKLELLLLYIILHATHILENRFPGMILFSFPQDKIFLVTLILLLLLSYLRIELVQFKTRN